MPIKHVYYTHVYMYYIVHVHALRTTIYTQFNSTFVLADIEIKTNT